MMTRSDRDFLLELADKLESVDRIRMKGITIDDAHYVLIADEQANILSTILQSIVKRDIRLEKFVEDIQDMKPKGTTLN